jgi:hypothetical protein
MGGDPPGRQAAGRGAGVCSLGRQEWPHEGSLVPQVIAAAGQPSTTAWTSGFRTVGRFGCATHTSRSSSGYRPSPRTRSASARLLIAQWIRRTRPSPS